MVGFLAGYCKNYDPFEGVLYGNVSASLKLEGSGAFYPLDVLPGLARRGWRIEKYGEDTMNNNVVKRVIELAIQIQQIPRQRSRSRRELSSFKACSLLRN